MDAKGTAMKLVSVPRIEPNFIDLSSLHEETWPPWLRVTLEVAFVIFIGVSMLVCLSIGG